MVDEEIAVPFDELDKLLKLEKMTWSSPEMYSPTGDIAPTTRRVIQVEYKLERPTMFPGILYVVKEIVKEISYEKLFSEMPAHAVYSTNIYLYKGVGNSKRFVNTDDGAVEILRKLLGLPYNKQLSLREYSEEYGNRSVMTYHEPDGWPKLRKVLG
jgi:hypothetical protein